jgi:hypothetical protein
MTDETRYLFAMSCILPTLVGSCLYRKMKHQYQWLVYIVLMDAITETVVFVGKKNITFEPIANFWSNAYAIVSLTLFLCFIWHSGYIKKRVLLTLVATSVIVAVCTFFQIGSVFKDAYFLICFVYAVQLYFSIDMLSKQVTVVDTKLMYNFLFWLSCLFVVQNAYGLLTFGVYLFGLSGTEYGKNIGILQLSVNVIYYCLLAIALLIVPKRNNRFIQQPLKTE